jgi:outer membrane protein assembly factor BamB
MVKVLLAVALISQFVISAPCSAAGVDVLVGRYDWRGTGANLHESVLNTFNVNPSGFGKLFSYEVEGFVYAQPLIVSGVSVRGRPRNLVYVATTNNMVYALDADDPGPDGGLLWQMRLTDHGAFPAPSIDKTGLTVQGNIGILSTPVIDRGRGAIYVVARSLGSGGYLQRLHALDLLTGRDKAGSPVDISHASVTRDGITFTFVRRSRATEQVLPYPVRRSS